MDLIHILKLKKKKHYRHINSRWKDGKQFGTYLLPQTIRNMTTNGTSPTEHLLTLEEYCRHLKGQ